MLDSNRTLRFNRTARDAYGHSVEFDQPHLGDRVVFIGAAFIAGLLVGMWVM